MRILCDGHFIVEVNVLNGVQQGDAVLHRTLEGLAAADEPHAPGALVDHGRRDGLLQIGLPARLAARVDQPHAAHVAVGHLIAAEVDGVVRSQLRVDLVAGLAEADSPEAAVVRRKFLLHDVGLDRHAQVVGLPREVGRSVVVDAVLLKALVAQVAPQDRRHAQFVRQVERLRDLDQLAAALRRTEIDRGPDGLGAHVPGVAHRAEQHLVVGVGVRQQLVVVDLDDEGDFVRVSARHGAQHAEGRGDGVAAAFEGEFQNVFRIEIGGIRGERSARGVLNALVHGQNRDIARAAQPSVRENPLQAAQRTDVAVGFGPDAVHGVGSRQVQRLLVDGAAYVGEVVAGLLP